MIPHDNEIFGGDLKNLNHTLHERNPKDNKKWLDHLRFFGGQQKGILYINKEYSFCERNGLGNYQGNPALTRFYKVFLHLFCHVFYVWKGSKGHPKLRI